MATTYLTRTPAGAGNLKTWTISLWVKFSTADVTEYIIGGRENSSNRFYLRRSSGGELYCYSVLSGSVVLEWTGARKLRDTSGWYNLVFRQDTTESTGADRFRVYINGVQEAITFQHTPDLNEDLYYNKNQPTTYGSEYGSTQPFNGLMSHIHFSDGYSYAPTVFGSTDATTGEWEINTAPTMTMGTNGYTILKDGNTITDQSSNSNNWTLGGGTLTATEDCPSDVFATMNPLESRSASGTVYPTGFHNGNNVIKYNDADTWTKGTIATLAPSAGKYYWELKVVVTGSDVRLGVVQGNYSGTSYGGNTTWNAYSYTEDGQKMLNGGGATAYGNSFTTGDYISFALDCGTGTIWCAKNGTWQNSATTSEISAGTTTNSMYTGINMDWGLTPHSVMYDATPNNVTLAYNFGNGIFGTTAISSEGTNASGIGKFEYDVPTGYTALSTKGLNS